MVHENDATRAGRTRLAASFRAIQAALTTRPSATRFVFATSLFLVLAVNAPFWRLLSTVVGSTAHDILFSVSVFALLTLAFNALLSLVAFRFVLKPIVILTLLTSSIALYFMNTYGVVLDRTMIQNALQTDRGEVAELLNVELAGYFLLLGVLPSIIVACSRIRFQALGREVATRVGIVVLSLAGIALLLVVFNKDYTFVGREHRELRYLINPTSYLYSSVTLIARSMRSAPDAVTTLGADARRGPRWSPGGRKAVYILVVGETARAQNFQLNGYERATNPRLLVENIINFTHVQSCGTTTATSLPCMFSHLDGRRGSRAQGSENLLDVVSRAGFNVVWRENNSGCKGVCTRVEREEARALGAGEHCGLEECFDETLLYKLRERVEAIDGDVLVVLHQKGSHGPAYHRRYPAPFAVFNPVCTASRLTTCSRESIVNAYDNTILYTDYFLSRVIAFLKDNSERFDGAMLYVSDHGESLGENSLYLHGLPVLMAPEEQTHVPMLMWFSQGFEERFAIDRACLSRRSTTPVSHRNLFHSVLGMMNIETSVRDEALDLFSPCDA